MFSLRFKTKNMNKLLKLTFLLVFFAFSFTPNSGKKVIVIDAGHGGKDLGAQHQKFTEQAFTLEIAQSILANNKREDVEIILIRNSDESLDLPTRVQKINELNPDLVISLHLNSSTKSDINGYEIFISDENVKYDDSKKISEDFLKYFESNPLENRGVKNARFKILRESVSPAFYFEMGFISSSNDREYLFSENGKNEIVSSINQFIDNF